MAVIDVLRDLFRHRRVVIVGLLIALTAMVLIVYRVMPGLPPSFESREYEVGIASGAVLIDSESSQAIDLGTPEVKVDVASLSARAKLLANLLVTRPLRDEIAIKAGVRPDRLITELSSTTEEGTPPPEATDVTVGADDPEANIISLQTSDTVPIITVNTQAPTEETAALLAASTIARLQKYLESVAAANELPNTRKLVMRPLGEPTSSVASRGPSKRQAVMVFLFLLVLWCGGVLILARVAKAWWQAAAYESPVDTDLFPERDLAPHPEGERAGRLAPARPGERPDHEAWLPPGSESTSRRVA
jgi:hypothetical protein